MKVIEGSSDVVKRGSDARQSFLKVRHAGIFTRHPDDLTLLRIPTRVLKQSGCPE